MTSGGRAIRKEVCFYSLLSAIDLGRPADKAHSPPLLPFGETSTLRLLLPQDWVSCKIFSASYVVAWFNKKL